MNTWLLLIPFIFHFTRYGITFPLIPLVAQSIGAEPTQIGFAVGAFGLIGVFLSIPLGGLIDRFGSKRMFLIGVLCNIASAVILLNTDTISGLVAAQLIAGMAFTLINVASQTFFSGLSNWAEREKGIGLLSLGASLGQGVGPFLGGFLAGRFGYQSAFYLVLVLSLLGLMVFGLHGKKPSNPAIRPYSLVGDFRRAGRLVLNPRIRTILLFSFVILFVANLNSSFFPVLLRSSGFGESDIGLLITLFGVTAITIRFFFSRLLHVLDRKKIIALAMSAVIAGVGLIPQMSSSIGFATALLIFGIGFGISQPLSMVMIADMTDPSLSGLSMGLRFTAMMAANLLSPIVFGLLVGIFGLKPVFYFAASAVLLLAVRILIIKPELIPSRRM